MGIRAGYKNYVKILKRTKWEKQLKNHLATAFLEMEKR